MDSYEIEQLVCEAVENRPRVTNAPLNLYIHKNKLICGSRTVMPQKAAFVAHISTEQLKNGFSEKEWKSIIDEIKEITGPGKLRGPMSNLSPAANHNGLDSAGRTNQKTFINRRIESRRSLRSSIRFSKGLEKAFSQGRMRDVSSGGLAFAWRTRENNLRVGDEITTRFSAPRFNTDNSFDTVNFARSSRIRRIDKVDDSLYCVAVQFATPLPFKPAEQA